MVPDMEFRVTPRIQNFGRKLNEIKMGFCLPRSHILLPRTSPHRLALPGPPLAPTITTGIIDGSMWAQQIPSK